MSPTNWTNQDSQQVSIMEEAFWGNSGDKTGVFLLRAVIFVTLKPVKLLACHHGAVDLWCLGLLKCFSFKDWFTILI